MKEGSLDHITEEKVTSIIDQNTRWLNVAKVLKLLTSSDAVEVFKITLLTKI